jgi:hypothetical protein
MKNPNNLKHTNFEHLFFEESIKAINLSLDYFLASLSKYNVDEAPHSMSDLIAVKERIEYLEKEFLQKELSSFAV